MSAPARRIALNTGVQVAGKIGMTLIAMVSVVLLTRYLGPEDYGKFTIALVYLSFFGIFADLGLFTIVVREISKTPERTREIVGNALSLRAVLSLGVIAVAVVLGLLLPYDQEVKVGIAIVALSIFFGLMNSSLITVFQARLQMGYSVIADLVGRTATLLAVIITIWLDLGFYAVAATAAVGSLVTFAVTSRLVRRIVPVSFLGDRRLWKELFRESLPLGAALAINQVYFRVDTIILSLLKSPTEVGNYGAAYKVLEILITFPGFFVNSVFPVLTKYESENDPRLRGVVQRTFDTLWLVSLPIVVGGVVLGPPLMAVVAGPEFTEAGLALQLLIPSVLFTFAIGIFSYGLVTKGRVGINRHLRISLAALVLNVAANIALIPTFGFKAAALTTVVTEALVFALLGWQFGKFYGFRPTWGKVARAGLAAVVMGVGVWATYYAWDLPLLIAIIVGAALYAVVAYALRAVTRNDVQTLLAKT